jgi:chemotaxis protein methyltransferase CheR
MPTINTPIQQDSDHTGKPVDRLMLLLKRFAGFRASAQIQRKLEWIFKDTSELEAFISVAEKDSAKTELSGENKLVELVEELTNHETYFFREKAHLDALEAVVIPALVQRKKQQFGAKKITLWSAACATGEEAFTLAMLTLNVLLKQGVAREKKSGVITLPPDWTLDVIGTDISRQAIQVAHTARYTYRQEGLSSFRQFPDDYWRFFDELEEQNAKGATAFNETPAAKGQKHYQVKDAVVRHTHFELFNLMSPRLPLQQADIIFCRNVLIYMDVESQKKILQSMHQALQPGGSLILSLVDAMVVPDLFQENRLEKCVVYEKAAYEKAAYEKKPP